MSDPAPLAPRAAVRLVAAREIRMRLRARSFRIASGLMIIVVVAIALISGLTGGGHDTYDVGAVGAASRPVLLSAQRQAGAFDATVKPLPVASAAEARRRVQDGKLDAAVLDGSRIVVKSDRSSELVALLQVSSRAARLRAPEPAPLPVTSTEGADGKGATGVAYVGALLLYIALLTAGYWVASGVVEEKGSRVVELLLASISARSLLAGKILGLGVLGLMQVGAVAVCGGVAAAATGAIDLPAATLGSLALVVLYFVLGYAFYACLYATAAALVSRQEDLQSATGPMTLLLVGSYIASSSALNAPTGGLAEVMTFLPPTAPLVVAGRAARHALPAWELALSLALMLVGIVLAARLAARVYTGSALRTGPRVKLRAALRGG